MNVGEIAAGVSAVVALASAVWAGKSAQRANAAADRSAAANERSAAAAEEANKLARTEAERYQVPWRITRVAEGVFSLMNDSENHEYQVQLDAVAGGFFVSSFPPQTIQKGAAVIFRASIDLDSYSDSVQVVWHRREDGSDRRQSWTWPLPN